VNSGRPVRVLIVDDQVLMRQGLRTLLDLDERVEVVGEAADGVEALEKVGELRPEVALVDVRMPRMDGVELVRRLSAEHPSVAALVLTTFEDDEYVFGGLRAGAKGYLLKDTPSEELAAAIVKVRRGETVLGGTVASRVVRELARLPERADAPDVEAGALSEREVEVLRLVGSGASNKEISRKLFITEGTAKNHISKILRKLDLKDRTQAALYAAERGWTERR
jgi:DNA-binding NarL/FixJ family response regulator